MGIQPIRKVVAPEIPDKLYFRIGDVAQLCEVPAYVLRFWETEFPQLKPGKGGTGQRLYRKRDVEIAMRIKSLLYDQGFTIPGARQVFKNETKARETAAAEAFLPVSAPSALEAVAESPQTAAAVLASVPADTGVPAATDPGADIRRQIKLRALREEMQALLDLLNKARTPQALSEVKPMRPRLVLEPRPTLRAEPPRVETLRLVREPLSGDLFAGE